MANACLFKIFFGLTVAICRRENVPVGARKWDDTSNRSSSRGPAATQQRTYNVDLEENSYKRPHNLFFVKLKVSFLLLLHTNLFLFSTCEPQTVSTIHVWWRAHNVFSSYTMATKYVASPRTRTHVREDCFYNPWPRQIDRLGTIANTKTNSNTPASATIALFATH